MTSLRPEVGKRYRTRDGSIVTILSVSPGGMFRCHGLVQGMKSAKLWTDEGEFGAFAEQGHPLDLIECIGESDEPPTSQQP